MPIILSTQISYFLKHLAALKNKPLREATTVFIPRLCLIVNSLFKAANFPSVVVFLGAMSLKLGSLEFFRELTRIEPLARNSPAILPTTEPSQDFKSIGYVHVTYCTILFSTFNILDVHPKNFVETGTGKK